MSIDNNDDALSVKLGTHLNELANKTTHKNLKENRWWWSTLWISSYQSPLAQDSSKTAEQSLSGIFSIRSKRPILFSRWFTILTTASRSNQIIQFYVSRYSLSVYMVRCGTRKRKPSSKLFYELGKNFHISFSVSSVDMAGHCIAHRFLSSLALSHLDDNSGVWLARSTSFFPSSFLFSLSLSPSFFFFFSSSFRPYLEAPIKACVHQRCTTLQTYFKLI